MNESVVFIRKGDSEVIHTKRKASKALYSIMFCMLALPRRAICSLESPKEKKLLTSAISNASKIHNAIKVCNIKGPKVGYKSACIVTMVAFVNKTIKDGDIAPWKDFKKN